VPASPRSNEHAMMAQAATVAVDRVDTQHFRRRVVCPPIVTEMAFGNATMRWRQIKSQSYDEFGEADEFPCFSITIIPLTNTDPAMMRVGRLLSSWDVRFAGSTLVW